MSDDVSVRRISFRQQFPAFRLLEAATIALAPSSMLIATLASILLGGTGGIVEQVFPGEQPARITGAFDEMWSTLIPGWFPNNVMPAVDALIRPWSSSILPVVALLTTSPNWYGCLRAVIELLLNLGLWSLAGVILCRRSAILFSGNEESTIPNAVQFSLKRWPTTMGAPLIPLFSAFLLGLIAAGFGLVGQLPFIGPLWLTVTSPATTLLGFAIAFLLLATAFAWPIMVASVATDDCDSFGSLSRAYSGLSGRPWQALGLACVGLLTGTVLISLVLLLGITTVWCTISSVALGSGTERADESLLKPATNLVRLVTSGVGISFFWSTTTILALLLRREVDGVPLERLAQDDNLRPPHDPLPVVGIPATDVREKPTNNE